MQIAPVSTNGLLITFGEIISPAISQKVQSAYQSIKALDDDALLEITPSYTTLLVTYDIFAYDFAQLEQKLHACIDPESTIMEVSDEVIVIDTYYGPEVGLDLERMCAAKGLSAEEIIGIHSQCSYRVYAIGFLPGFGFLGEVDERIAMPRLDAPRKRVPAGSVAIAERQTAVYPRESVGGWNIIGQTPRKLFDPALEGLSPLRIGATVQFRPITRKEFIQQGGVL